MGQTEVDILARLAGGNAPNANDFNRLDTKLGRGQKKEKARNITDGTEGEYLAFYNGQAAAAQVILSGGISNYTLTSLQINTDARAGNMTGAIASVDAALNIGIAAGVNVQQRICYRLMTYTPGTPIPYHANAANPIVVGDSVYDLSFVSASENRQFLVNGIRGAVAGTRYVKMCIIGQGGVNISGHGFNPAAPNTGIGSKYTNAAEQAVVDIQNGRNKWYQKNAAANSGPAEILFPRGHVFRVENISVHNADTHVVLSSQNPQPAGPLALPNYKNMFSGQ